MRCHKCFASKSRFQCGNGCGTFYCGVQCAQSDWATKHQLICGKPKREREEDIPCNNTRDPFTMDDFEGMDANLIIHIGADCFHLPSLYAWVFNQKTHRNPLTNLPFTAQQLDIISTEAKNRFPLTLVVMEITGRKVEIQTTNLASPLSLIPLIIPEADTLFEFMTRLSQRGEAFTLQVPLMQRSMSFVELIDGHTDRPMHELGFDNRLTLYHSLHGTPPQGLARNEMYLEIATRRHLPVEPFASQVVTYRRVLEENDAFNRRAENGRRIRREVENGRRMRREAAQEPQPPGTRRFYARLVTQAGFAHGSFLVYPNLDGQFADLEPMVREQFRDIVDLPDTPMRYAFAGILYPGDIKFSAVANLVDDVTIYIVF